MEHEDVCRVNRDETFGHGTIIHDDGTAFRVWAPHADRVSVIGTFPNTFSPSSLTSFTTTF